MSRKTQKILTKNLTRIYLLCTSTEKRKVENLIKNSSGKWLLFFIKFSTFPNSRSFSELNFRLGLKSEFSK
jgi:hypothetical protein